ncbi:Retrovirus-related Pol polyprotein from transposon TNT 1-94 [Vitis vinifera]|uniref:Retrovirus-related Pol polyprotein from transposon TNT 1-94 n=1 Tax=Vitis vinifera TaxID=29760 RepID=A0A438H814_VITVI|nr:Retrovirus-related Pol polyprotein from transposon TNT 1-94 [Vitis vinifera]
MTILVKGASEEDVVFLSRMIEWDSHNHMILTWIRNTSIPSISNLLVSFDDAKSAWDMLTKRYSTTHGSMKYQLVVELHQLRQEQGQSINDYYDQLRFIWDQIDLTDPTWACLKDAQQYASIKDEFHLYEFLMSLHKDFEPIRGLLNRSPAPSLDTAVNELVREEARLATLQAQNKLNVLAIIPSTPLIEQPHQLGDFSGSSNRRKQTNKKFCNYCKHPGHTIETCYHRNKSTTAIANTEPTPPMASTSAESQSSGSTINLSSTELQEIIAQAVRMDGNASLSTALSVLLGKSQTWLFDSACCNHMTPHSSLFSNLDPAPHPLNIHIADGSTMHGNSLGFVSTSNLSVPGVFHDPRMGQELGTGPRVGRMFPVNNLHLPPVASISVAVVVAAVSSLPSLALWHSRLGHAPSSRVQQLVSRGLLGSVSKDNFDCTSCTSQQNGRAERKLRHILDTVRALLLYAKVPAPFWGEASLHAVHAINRIPSAVIHNQTLYERLFGSLPDYHHLRSFGSTCFVLLQPHEHNKLEPRSRLCCFLGYGETQKGYRCYDPVSHRLRVSRNVVFWEHRLFVELSHFRSSLTNSSVLEIFPDESLVPSTNTFNPPLDFSPDIFDASPRQVADEQIDDELPHFELGSPAPALPEDPPQDIPPRHSTRVRSIPPHLLDYHCYTALATLHEPQTYREASTDPLWQIAMIEELDALTKNHTWDLVTLPPGQSVVGCKWIYKIKTHSDGSVERYKARLVAKGFTQEYGIDYEETFAPVARISSVRALLVVSAAHGLYITQAKYASDLLSQARLTDSKTVDTPVELNVHLTPSRGKPLSNPSLYRRLVGSLVYLTVTRLDISYAVHQVSQYLSAPRSTHYAVVLRILRYLKGTLFHGLFYSAQSPLVLRAFFDADWAGNPTDRRSTTGYCFLLGSSLISWRTPWLRWLLKDLGVSTSSATPLYCDNQSAIHIAHNDVFHERTKHIEIDCHFIRYHLVHGALKLFSVSSKDQLADIFTKSLPKRRTRDLVDNLKLVSHPP